MRPVWLFVSSNKNGDQFLDNAMAAPESMIMMSAASTSSPYSYHARDLQEGN
jgi:hypothetical protein